MNAKQLAALLLAVGIVLLVQFGLSLRGQADAAATKADKVAAELRTTRVALKNEKDYYEGQLKDIKGLVGFAKQWEPYFAVIEDQNEAETGISMKVRAADMLNLSQRYELLPHTMNNKPNESLPLMVRASLHFEDTYAKLINWTNDMERTKPTMRVGRVHLAPGSRGNDVRMELVLEIPLRDKKEKK